MIPILYASVTEGSVPTDYGLGALTDCLACQVTEQRNGQYELVLEYASGGIHAEDIEVNRFILAKPNFTDNPQLFRIYKIGKTINGRFRVNAQHISYDLSGKLISTGTAGSITAACLLLQSNAGNFTIATDKLTSGDFAVDVPSSVRSWFGGKSGSLLDVYGTGEWHYDNYACTLKANRGADRNVQIRYGKNLTELSQEINIENLATGILPYCVDGDGNKTVGTLVQTGLTLDVDRDMAVDFSDEVDFESGTALSTQLASLASAYVANNNFITGLQNITLDFVQLSDLTERVDLCDTVHIYFEPLGISASLKCIETTWDTLKERYVKCEFGDSKTNITDTIVTQEKKIAEKPSTSFMGEAIHKATEAITGNLGGYVVIHDANSDGEPDEILIMDTPDISTAVKVWRWNASGLAYSDQGYDPAEFTLAITSQGEIVADFITTGTLTANLIKAGVLQSVNGKSSIDMTSGVATLYQLIARRDFTIKDDFDVVRAYISLAGVDTQLRFRDENDLQTLASFGSSGGKGFYVLRNASGNSRVHSFIGANDDGIIDLYDGNGNITLSLSAHKGQLECKHIKPYDLVVGTDYGMTGSGAFSVDANNWIIKRMGNEVFMQIPFHGNNTSIANGANAFSGTLTKGPLPVVGCRFATYASGSCFVLALNTDGSITIRNTGSAITISSSTTMTFCVSFLVDD